MPTIPCDQLQQLSVSMLQAGGATSEEARIVGHSLVLANACGYASHGVMRLPFYLDMLAKGDIVSGVDLQWMSQAPSILIADAQWGFGRVQAGRLLDHALEATGATGICVATLRHSSHIGRLGEYCEIAADQGFVSMMVANTHGAARRVAPPGGVVARLGTNPIAYGVPADDGHMVLDFSTSATAEGKVRVKKIAGETCPDGWLLDSQGKPTNDPESLYADPPGTILPMGGVQTYKGFGLAMMVDVLAGGLSGGLCARETPETPKGNCAFLMLLDPEKFGGKQHFQQEVGQLIQFVRECPRAEGVDRIRLPGDPEREFRTRCQTEGVTLDDENWNQLLQRAQALGVEVGS